MADTSKQEDRKPNWINNCTYSSASHKSNCPAYNKNVGKCDKRGNFAKMCRSKNKNPRNRNTHDGGHHMYEHHHMDAIVKKKKMLTVNNKKKVDRIIHN